MWNNYTTVRKDFYTFVNEWDRRKGTSFLYVFPEYKDFYEMCGGVE